MQIDCFVEAENECYICGYEWTIVKNTFNGLNKLPTLPHFLKVFKKGSKLVVHSLNMLKRKVIVIDIGTEIHITFSPNNYKRQ